MMWVCETLYSMQDLHGLDLNDFISELSLWREDGFTNIDLGDTMFFVKRLETSSECKDRKRREKDDAIKFKAKKEAEERKLYLKLKKKYEGV